jgi:hypothetical protein
MSRPRKTSLRLNCERVQLEAEFCGDLQTARAAAAEDGVADADVAGGLEAQGAGACTVRVDAVRRSVGYECGQVRVGEIRVIE